MDGYSRFVALFKVLLPLAALAILATLFLLSRSVDYTATVPFAEDDMADRLKSQQITAPFFSGTTANGDEITVTAALARPGSFGAPAEAVDVRAKMTRARGDAMTLESRNASVDVEEDMATFTGNVRVATAAGFLLVTEELSTALHGISGRSPGTVTGTGPFGDFTAGSMEFGAKTEDGPVQFLFKGGIKLVYLPKKAE